MPKQYIKHDREVTTEQLQKYGKYATHDIHVPILLLYPIGNITDANGTHTKIDDEFINATMKATNNAIKKRHSSPLAKVKSFFQDDISKYEIIPIIKNHNTKDVDGIAGHTQGLTYLSEINGVKCLLINGVVKDPETKSKMVGDLFRNTSLGTRADGSIKEISIVSNEALAHGGFMMSENEIKPIQDENMHDNITSVPIISKPELLLTEEIHQLQLQEAELDNTIIPNHLKLAKMIKSGKIEPYKYDELIKQPTEIIQLMESILPSNNLGIMYGTKIIPKTIKSNEVDSFIDNIVNSYKNKKDNTTKKNKQSNISQDIDVIQKNGYSFEELRQKELRHILELAEHSPTNMQKYISIELGEDVEPIKASDKYLTEYLEQSKVIKTKIKNLQIQLGEYVHE